MKLYELIPVIDPTRIIKICDRENNEIETIYDFNDMAKYDPEDVMDVFATFANGVDYLAISVNY